MAQFELAIPVILAHETLPGSTDGSYTNTPGDQGGATKWGITAHTLGAWRKLGRDATPEEVQGLGRDEALAIYRAWYWDLFRCGEVEDQVVATKVFDMGVNMAPGAVANIVQGACNRCQEQDTLPLNGVLGPRTVAAVNRCVAGELLVELVHLAEEHYRAIVAQKPNQQKFLADWLSRARWPFKTDPAAPTAA